MMKIAKRDWIVADASTQTMRCEHCGEEIPIPLGDIDWVVSVMTAFDKAHRFCKKDDPRDRPLCYFSEPVKRQLG